MRVIFDLDSTLLDFHSAIDGYRRSIRVGPSWPLDPATDWDYLKCEVWKDHLSSYRSFLEFLDEFMRDGGYGRMEPFPGAVEFVAKVKAAGHTVVVATHRLIFPGSGNSRLLADTTACLSRCGLLRLTDELCFTPHKHLLGGDVLFDDGPHNLAAVWEHTPKCRTVKVAWPHNKGAYADVVITPEMWPSLDLSILEL